MQFLAAAHISRVNCDEMALDRPRELAYEIFSIKYRFFVVQVPTAYVEGGLCTRASKSGTFLKSAYFTDIGLFTVKMVADRNRH